MGPRSLWLLRAKILSYHAQICLFTQKCLGMVLNYQDNDFTCCNEGIATGWEGPNSLVTMLQFALFALKCIDMGLNDQDNDFRCHN